MLVVPGKISALITSLSGMISRHTSSSRLLKQM